MSAPLTQGASRAMMFWCRPSCRSLSSRLIFSDVWLDSRGGRGQSRLGLHASSSQREGHTAPVELSMMQRFMATLLRSAPKPTKTRLHENEQQERQPGRSGSTAAAQHKRGARKSS
jgi:hypothetical protein